MKILPNPMRDFSTAFQLDNLMWAMFGGFEGSPGQGSAQYGCASSHLHPAEPARYHLTRSNQGRGHGPYGLDLCSDWYRSEDRPVRKLFYPAKAQDQGLQLCLRKHQVASMKLGRVT